MRHTWPGNVRELENTLWVACLCERGEVIGPESIRIDAPLLGPGQPASYDELLAQLATQERAYVRGVLAAHGGNKSNAADALGISRTALYRTLRRLEIEGPLGASGVEGRLAPAAPRRAAS